MGIRLIDALETAATAHDGHYRKGTTIPYFAHVAGVMQIAGSATIADRDGGTRSPDEDTLIACLFHDILEDVPERYDEDRMRAEFGAHVVEIVKAVTKDSSIRDWRARNEDYLARLAATPLDEAVVVASADKIYNLTAQLRDVRRWGEASWDRFNAGKDQQTWWYRSVLDVCTTRLPGLSLNDRLADLVAELDSGAPEAPAETPGR